MALDMDGTLVGDTLTVSLRVARAVAGAHSLGVHVTISTGRMLEVAEPYARQLGISAPLICYQGGLVQALSAPAPLYVASMDAALMHEILTWALPRQWHPVLYTQNQAYATRGPHPPLFYEVLSRERILWVDSLPQILEHEQPLKLIFIDDVLEADNVEREMSRLFKDRVAVVRSHRWVVEGSPLGVSKGDGLRRVAEHLQISRAQTMAIGDQDNDVSMVEWAGVGVAMGNGSRAVQAAADWIAPSLEEDGAAAAIERFVLHEAPVRRLCISA